MMKRDTYLSKKNYTMRLVTAKPILVCLMAKCTYKTQTYRPTDNA